MYMVTLSLIYGWTKYSLISMSVFFLNPKYVNYVCLMLSTPIINHSSFYTGEKNQPST